MLLRTLVVTIMGLSVLDGFSGVSANAKEISKTKNCKPEVLNTPIFWETDRLAVVKTRLEAKEAALMPAYDALIKRANTALSVAPYSVTDKKRPGPSGDLHDYVSLSRYFWPNPKTKDGLPYIRKDGQSNPEINSVNFDRRRSQEMTNTVRDLSLAAYFSEDSRYADKF